MSEIRDGIYGHVAGTVSSVFMYKDGMAITVDVKNPVKENPDKVTAWGISGTIVSEGDRVKVKGWLSAVASTFEKRDGSTGYGVKVSLNKPQIIEHERLPGAQPPAPAAVSAVPAAELFLPADDDSPF